MIVVDIIGINGSILASNTIKDMTILECQKIGFDALKGLKDISPVFIGARVELSFIVG